MKTAAGLADLVRSLAALPHEQRSEERWDTHARVLGLQRVRISKLVPATASPQPAPVASPARTDRDTTVDDAVRVPMAPHNLPPVPFWRAVEYQEREDPQKPAQAGSAPRPLTPEDLGPTVATWPRTKPPIEAWSRLWPRLVQHLATERTSRSPDVRALVQRVASARPLVRIPRLRRRAWASRAVIVQERDATHTWLAGDQSWLDRQLRRVMGNRAIELRLLPDGPAGLPYDPRLQQERDWSPVAHGTPLLAVGSFAEDAAAADGYARAWRRLGLHLRRRGYATAALVARPAARTLRGLQSGWRLVPWERHTWQLRSSRAEREDRVRALLTLAAPAVVVSAQLLRELRLLLPAHQADVATEADAWTHPDLEVTTYGLRFRAEQAQSWLQRFANLDDIELQREAWRLISQYQQVHGREVNHLSAWRVQTFSDNDILAANERDEAAAFAARLSRAMERAEPGPLQAGLRTWFRQLCPLLPEQTYTHDQFGESLSRAWHQSHDEHEQPPASLHPWHRPADVRARIRELDVVSRAGGIWLTGSGSPIGRLRFVHTAMTVHDGLTRPMEPGQVLAPQDQWLSLTSDQSLLRLQRLPKPEWARAIGRDRHGLWVECVLADVAMRMRWIPPGRFIMGSPLDEPGRFDREGPQHEVIVRTGFWLAETPCTQALWTAVMGENPSYFESPDRPVESVSFHTVQAFIGKLNERWPDDSRFRLPTEAEWEYACRAGTQEATYAGPIEIQGERNAPILDSIAWYGGNSGLDYELDVHHDSSDWPAKQHPHQRAGSHPVARRGCNPWGLYDMLGNVYEWCNSTLRSYTSERYRTSDERYESTPEHAYRVVRGGSWLDDARRVRAAYRGAYRPTRASDVLGFRVARDQ